MRTGRGGGALSPIKIIMGTRIPQTRLEPELAIDSFGSQEKKIWQKIVRGGGGEEKEENKPHSVSPHSSGAAPDGHYGPAEWGVRRENKRKYARYVSINNECV